MVYNFMPATLSGYQDYAIEVAKELHYSENVIENIKNAKTQNEITRILHDARNGVE